jgi:hypothetical protein
MTFIEAIMRDPTWSVVALALIIVLFTQVIKLPIKALINLLIKNKAVVQRVNIIFMLLPIGLSILAQLIHSTLWGMGVLDIAVGLKISTTATSIYVFLEQLLKGKASREAKAVQKFATDIAKDGKIDRSDLSAKDEFLKAVK